MTKLSGSLDTNGVLRLLLEDVPEHHEAITNLLEKTKYPLRIADIAIIEVVFVLGRHYKRTRVQIAEAIQQLISFPEISCDRTLFRRALTIFLRHPGLSFEDCCLAVYAQLNHAEPLWTFDKKLARQVSSAELIPSQ